MKGKKIRFGLIGMLLIGLGVSGSVYGSSVTPSDVRSSVNAGLIDTATSESTMLADSTMSDAGKVLAQAVTTVYIAGDSTACTYKPSQAPGTGWGQALESFFDLKQVAFKNMARAGRSSKSFVDEGHLDIIAKSIKTNDYILIQFGHNDAKGDAARRTEPFTTYKTYLTKYITVARQKGALPVLLTPVNRNKFNSAGKLNLTHGDYPKAMLELGKELNVPVIDITEKSRQLFETLGPAKTYKLFMNLEPGESPNYPMGNKDNTHFTLTGATEIAKLVVEGLRELNLPLTQQLK